MSAMTDESTMEDEAADVLGCETTGQPSSYETLVEENRRLKAQLHCQESQLRLHEQERLKQGRHIPPPSAHFPPCASTASPPVPSPPASSSSSSPSNPLPLPPVHSLSSSEISRYSRQLLVSRFGVTGQRNLLSSSVLVVGAGDPWGQPGGDEEGGLGLGSSPGFEWWPAGERAGGGRGLWERGVGDCRVGPGGGRER
ncbi:molybdopterin biosynthesis [Nannochloropsis gaditana]|uniref:Molybdopterin biosynthesis n=1 Tax=Nannochloropsis gaditana TaxID=72520 RepID=W7TQS9_9STRA|nr:molybdopterin biosynthesis [Nannochloropsis gaditana]